MQTHIYFRAMMVSVLLIIALPLMEAQITYDMRFSKQHLSISTDTVDGNLYTVVEYSNLHPTGEPGKPGLPVKFIHFSVPCYAKDFVATVTEKSCIDIDIDYPLMPIQQQAQANFSIPPAFSSPDTTIYKTNGYYPAEAAEIAEEGYYDGENHIVAVSVSPLSYNPIQKKIRLYTSISVSLSYSIASSPSELKMKPISRAITAKRIEGQKQTESIVVNPAQVAKFAPATIPTIKPLTVVGLPAYEYCVITSRELAPAFNRLIGWKRQKGYTAGVVCIEDILSCSDFQSGDEVSGINDDAGKLRAYLKYTYSGDGSGKYVLLAGDYTVLPIRYGSGMDNHTNEDNNIPTDLYFSDMNGNWNVDKDEFYGEKTGDNIDFSPELFVGRLLCTTAEEINNYTEKLLRYERNPGNGNYAYLKKGFLTQCDGMLKAQEADDVAACINSFIPKSTIFSELPSYNDPNPTFPTGSQCINEMNNYYGFFSWHGHGQPFGVSVRSDLDNDWNWFAILALTEANNNMKKEDKNGLDKLTNHNYPAIAYSMSCDLTPFDIYANYNPIYNIGESFTVGGLYGGPAFLGNTRFGYYSSIGGGASVTLEINFLNQIKAGNYNIGIAEANSKTLLSNTSTNYYIKLSHNLIGCPELEMWTDIPFEYNAKNITVIRKDNSVTVGGSELQGSRIALTSGQYGIPGFLECSGTKITSPNTDPNTVITVYKHNAIPYVLPVIWQNGEAQSKQYYFTNDVTIGRNVDSSRRTKGDYVFTKDADVTIESNGDISINDGFRMESGATLTIKTTRCVTISGGEMESGATLSITAPLISIQKGFSVEKGAILNLNYK